MRGPWLLNSICGAQGTVLDGTGAPAREADVAVQDGRIAAVGRVAGAGREEIDAKGLAVTPGFVDIHTHYDGQATWDQRFVPSSGHGVTTVVMGNCGVGFAPCRPQDRDTLIKVMEGVEDIPELVMREGVPWNWQSFPDYLDALAQRRCDIDFATQVPHAPLRVFVMGRRGVDREPATTADMAAMAALVEEGLLAGALGFTTSRSLFHRTPDGALTPTITAGEEELAAIAAGMAPGGQGRDPAPGRLRRHARRLDRVSPCCAAWSRSRGGRSPSPCSTSRSIPALEDASEEVARANARAAIKGQVAARPVAILYGLSCVPPVLDLPSYREIEACHWKASSSGCAIRRARAASQGGAVYSIPTAGFMRKVANMFVRAIRRLHAARRRAAGRAGGRSRRHPLELAYDLLVSGDGRNILFHPAPIHRLLRATWRECCATRTQ